jgi:Ran GTPase-activating protein (RanGAP) involved in mRNA processing and transport/serine/threonine protein kinase
MYSAAAAAATTAIAVLLVASSLSDTACATNVCFDDEIGFVAGSAAQLFVIPPNCTLIYLANDNIQDVGATALAKALAGNTVVTQLNLQNNDIGVAGAVALAEMLMTNTAINRLDLDSDRASGLGKTTIGNRIGSAGAAALAEAFKVNAAVATVHMRGNNIGDAGAASLAQAFMVNSVITWVDLGKNSIGAEGAASLATVLQTNNAITLLELDDNAIGDLGAASLANALEVNIAITGLHLDWCSIGDAGAVALARALRGNPTVVEVNLYVNSIGTAGAIALSKAFAVNVAITDVGLGGNNIRDDGAIALAEALAANSAITVVTLRNCSIGDVGAVALAAALGADSGITLMDLSDNSFGDVGARALVDALRVNPAMTTMKLGENRIQNEWIEATTWLLNHAAVRSVDKCSGSGLFDPLTGKCQCSGLKLLGGGPTCAGDTCGSQELGLVAFQQGKVASLIAPAGCTAIFLDNNGISDTDATALADLLNRSTAITSVDLSSNRIGPAGAASLAAVLTADNAITWLDLSKNTIGVAGARSLAKAFMVNSAIISVYLDENVIGDDGAVALAEAFAVNAAITTVQLGGNNIRDVGATALAAALKVNSAITIMGLHTNIINAEGAAALAEAFKVNQVLVSVDLHSNRGIGDEGARALAEAFKTNSVIKSVDLDRCTIGAAGAAYFAEAFKANSAISVVELSSNELGTAGAASLAEALKVNNAITALYLRGNSIGDSGAASLAEALKVNTALTFIDLSVNGVGPPGAAALVAALKQNTAISTMIMVLNVIGAELADAIAWLANNAASRSVARCSGSGTVRPSTGKCACSGLALLGAGPTCADVVCGAMDVGLAQVLRGALGSLVIPPFCTVLDLSNSGIGDNDAVWLAGAFKGTTTTISAVDLSSNTISLAGAIALAEALLVNRTNITVNLADNVLGDNWMAVLRCHSYSRSYEVAPACAGAGTTSTKKKALVSGAVAVAVVLIVLVVVACCYLALHTRRRSWTSSGGTVASKFLAVAKERAEARFVIEYRQLVNVKSMAEFQHEFKQLEVSRSAVKLGAELGRGQSGIVFRATLSTCDVRLAIKTRAEFNVDVGGAAAVADEALMLEAMLLNGLRHRGIVELLAVVTSAAPVLVCMELMENGDLRDYLRACRPSSRPVELVAVSAEAKVAIAAKLASAMAFLEGQSIIHRDIAARNVLVGKHVTHVKLADLGAARNVHRVREADGGGVYIATTDHSPARWMPLEALREAKFSHKSDVFAFGVLLWEVLTLGQTPWGAFEVHGFTQALSNGERLAFPSATTNTTAEAADHTIKSIYAVALRCWKENPAKRPHFHQLEVEFSVHLTVLTTGSATAASGHRGSADIDGGPAAVVASDYLLVDSRGTEQLLPDLDGDGYVAESTRQQQFILDDCGYVADLASQPSATRTRGDAGSDRGAHAADGGSCASGLRPAPGGSRSHVPVTRPLPSAPLGDSRSEGQCQLVATGLNGAPGIAPGRGRAASVYNGFGDGGGAIVDESSYGPRLTADESSIMSPTSAQSSATSPTEGKAAPTRSLNLRLEQEDSRGAGLHDDGTRL